MEACVVNCGGPSEHSTTITPFAFPTPTEASPTTRRSLTFCESPVRQFAVSFSLFQLPAWLLLLTLSVLSPKKWGLAISSKHVTILIESCKSADNLGNYCRNAFAVNFNFCLTDLISLKCKKGKKVCSRYCKNFSQNERGKGLASVRFIEARTINILCLALSCVLCPVYNNSFFIF